MCGWFTTPFAGIRNGSDSPEIVRPSTMHVTRARTKPKLAGTFGSTQDPSGRTRTLRFNTLIVQFSLSCVSLTCAEARRPATASEATVSAMAQTTREA